MGRGATIVDGMRGPDARGALQPDGKNQTVPAYLAEKASARKAKESDFKPRLFVSRYGSLRVQIDAPHDVHDAKTGKNYAARCRYAQFADGSYLCKEKEDFEALIAHANYGLGRSFWLAEEAEAIAKEKQYEDAKNMLESDPELKKRLLAEIKGDAFPVGPGDAATA